MQYNQESKYGLLVRYWSSIILRVLCALIVVRVVVICVVPHEDDYFVFCYFAVAVRGTRKWSD